MPLSDLEIAAAFPKEYKKSMRERIPVLKKQQAVLLQEIRKAKNNLQTDYHNAWLYELLLEALTLDQEEITKQLRYALWSTRSGQNKGLDITRAKAYPITQFITFTRNKAVCPWHDDSLPSLQYYPLTNSVHCFSCGKSGDAIDLMQVVFNLTFKEAVNKLTI